MRAILLLATLPLACARAEGDPRPAAEGPLVLELFTSQGCSSCPPADRLLAKLARSAGDRPLAPLSFHVDYWNDLGWADPFSTAAWTERQQQYARRLKEDRIYTPELVVGGTAGMIGSNAALVGRAIQDAPRPALLPATAQWAADAVTVAATAPDGAEVWVAVWEETTSTKVPRGENAGETLSSARVVRRFAQVATPGHKGSISVKIDPAWRSVGAVAFAQRPDGRIVASAMLPHS